MLQIIQGNLDGKNVITRKLDPSINLDGISITPVTWKGQEICMKIRLYGCDYGKFNIELLNSPHLMSPDPLFLGSPKLFDLSTLFKIFF